MNSPVDIQFSTFIHLQRTATDPIYLQLVYQFINAVKRHRLEVGDRIPGSRKIAEDLHIHRKTVLAGLEELQAQGWLVMKPNIGTFVQNPEENTQKIHPNKAIPTEKAVFSFKRDYLLDTFPENDAQTYFFTDGTPNYQLISSKELLRFYAAVLKRERKLEKYFQKTDENAYFKNQLAYYLNLTRNFHLSKEFLLTTKEKEQIYYVISQLLLQQNSIVLVENPSYSLANMLLSQSGAKLLSVPMDEEGISVEFIRTNFQKGAIRLLYLNTRCQYPTTVKMSVRRQQEVLQLAEDYDFILVEDDTDFEFSAGEKNRKSLFQLDKNHRTIYLGVFGGFLFPDFQVSFLVGPKDFIVEGKKYAHLFGRPNVLLEQALGEMIHEGDIHRYRRKAQQQIAERKAQFYRLLHEVFPTEIDFVAPETGCAFWITFRKQFSLIALLEKAQENGLTIPRSCAYQTTRLIALRLGFAHLSEEKMRAMLHILRESYLSVIPQ